jgi:arsenate reductase
MAEGFFREIGQWESCSAGSKPSGYVHPLAIEAMKDCGIDISSGESKSVDLFKDQQFDLVVSVCDNANEDCPVFPGATDRQHWPFDDPADAIGTPEEKMKMFVRVRDEIKDTIEKYLKNNS